jgi:hypothetical protein
MLSQIDISIEGWQFAFCAALMATTHGWSPATAEWYTYAVLPSFA